MKTFCKAFALKACMLCAIFWVSPLTAQTFFKKTYGGKIEGSIKVDKVTLNAIDKNIDEVITILGTNLRVYRYEQLNTQCRKLSTENLVEVPVAPKIELASTQDDHYVLSYSVGMVSDKPIFVQTGTQTYLEPYITYVVKIKGIRIASGAHRVMAFLSDFGPMGGVAYLNECDKVFECYDFTTYCNCIN